MTSTQKVEEIHQLCGQISVRIKTCKQKGVGGGQTIQKVGDVMYGSPPTEKLKPEEGELG